MTNTSDAVVFHRLRALKAECGADKHDQATVLISACILEGWNTGKRIVGALRRLGFDYRHVAIILKKETGNDPGRHRWQLGSDGQYSLHDDDPRD